MNLGRIVHQLKDFLDLLFLKQHLIGLEKLFLQLFSQPQLFQQLTFKPQLAPMLVFLQRAYQLLLSLVPVFLLPFSPEPIFQQQVSLPPLSLLLTFQLQLFSPLQLLSLQRAYQLLPFLQQLFKLLPKPISRLQAYRHLLFPEPVFQLQLSPELISQLQVSILRQAFLLLPIQLQP